MRFASRVRFAIGGDANSIPFDNLEFSVTIDGHSMLDVDFSTVAEADAYFTDHVLSFSVLAQDIDVALAMTATTPQTGGLYAGYGLQVEIGSGVFAQSSAMAGPTIQQSQLIATPEPGTASFLLLGLGAIASRRRRRSTK